VRSSRAMPMPVSDTANASVTPSVATSFVFTVTVTDPAGVNLTALPTRLLKIWRMATGSPHRAGGTFVAAGPALAELLRATRRAMTEINP